MQHVLFDSFFLIFTGAALIASVALFTRQPLLVAYIVVGAALGPFGFGLITDINLISEMSHIGIIFLLFLLGLDMQPSALLSVLRKASSVGLVSSALFAIAGYGIGAAFGFTHMESLIIGMAMMFSSTIIGIKLLPTTVLHHKHTGEMMVGLLLIQDFLAILCLMVLLSGDASGLNLMEMWKAFIGLPILGVSCYLLIRFVILPLIQKFDRFHEYVFLLAIGWCLGIAELALTLGLSAEIGAFLAGISLAISPISQYIAISLKPLRDFFLVLFFFSLGAQLNITLIPDVMAASIALAAAALLFKPLVIRVLLGLQKESRTLGWDIGFRLGQISEFSLLIIFVAVSANLIGERAATLVQTTAIITFLISSYIVIFNYPNPIAVSDRLRRD